MPFRSSQPQLFADGGGVAMFVWASASTALMLKQENKTITAETRTAWFANNLKKVFIVNRSSSQ